MALTVGTNSGALMAQAAASSVNKTMENSMERLATGKRINSASDDAAGVAIASRLTSEIRGTNQAIRNAMDGQALIDTAEGAQKEVENLLQRMREIAVQSVNDTNNSSDRANLQLEMTALVSEIDRISSTTTWAGQNLLDGSDTDGFTFQVGSRSGTSDSITAVIASSSSSALGIGAPTLAAVSVTQGGAENATTAGVFEFGAGTSATMIVAGKSFTAGHEITAGTGNAILSANTTTQTADNVLVAATGTGTKNFSVNGVKVEYSGSATAATAAANLAAAFNLAKIDNTTLNHLTATVNNTTNVDFTSTAASVASNLKTKIEADTSVASQFTLAQSTGTATNDTLTFSVKTTASTTTAGSNTFATDGGVTVTAGTNAANTAGTFTVLSTGDSAIDTADTNNTITLTVDGVTVAYNTFTDGVQNGFGAESGTETAAGQANQHAAGIIEKFKEAGLTGVTFSFASGVISASKGGQAVDISTATGATSAIAAIDSAIQTVGNQRAVLGATSNRLDSTVANLTNIATNLSAGRGRIEDADFAAETTSLAKSQILQQASTAMLAQANASKQGVLSLLQG
jgi:flagellin